MTIPKLDPPMFLHDDVAALFLYVSFMSSNRMSLHGWLELQSNIIPSDVADVPLMFLYVTSLIFTPELFKKIKQIILLKTR